VLAYEYVDTGGEGVLSDWRLEKRQRRALRNKLRMLRSVDWQLAAGSLLHKTKTADIWEFEVRGNVQLRPMACFGPADKKAEITFLAQAVERDNRIEPTDVCLQAANNLAILLTDIDGKRRDPWPLLIEKN
jgi:hypothetical protein